MTSEPVMPPFDASVVVDLLRQLDRTVRAHQLYPGDNPSYRKTLENLRTAFGAAWKETGSLALQVTDTEFIWSGVPVLSEPQKVPDSLPWTLYKDGVREITLAPGFEGEELLRLLDIIPRVRRSLDDQDDILTLFWEEEFAFFSYRFIETDTAEGVPLDPSATPGRWPVSPGVVREDPRQAIADAKRRTEQSHTGSTTVAGRLEPALDEPPPAKEAPDARVPPAGSQAGYLSGEIEREYATDLRRSALDVLLDILELQEDPQVRQEVTEHLDALSLHLLTRLEFANVTHLVREGAVVLERASGLTSDIRERIERLVDRVSDPAVLAPLLEALDAAEAPPGTKEFADFVDRLRPRALGTLFTWSAVAKRADVRSLLAAAAERLARSSGDELVKLIGSHDQIEALEATKRSGALRLEAAVQALGRLLGSPADDLRVAAVAALIEIGTPRALHGVERAMHDTSRGIRMTALKALTAKAHRPAAARVADLVASREVREMDRNERQALFELHGTLCGDAGIPWLESQLIGPSGFFKRKSDPEVRLCVAAALGRIGSEAARAVLTKALDEKDVLIRRAVTRALGKTAT